MLEGFHPLKHALRFGAEVEEIVTPDAAELGRLAELLAPELASRIEAQAREVEPALFAQLAPLPPTTGVIALAERPEVQAGALLAAPSSAPLVVLEDPRDLGNMGACVRVAAAADAGGVLSTGSHDPWHPDALRGAAGLHFALPVARLADLSPLEGLERTILALDPEGEALDPANIDPGAVLVFGTERHGLSGEALERADRRVRIPMRPGVSSLNLATSVAAVLFAWRLSERPGGA